ncbi:hypothetical protein B0H13DRAFT_2415027 [Mycena leptocephala]|nr:hypothetical protein B0H13DRAFT_2415027 [Mycena leptocephala]
MPSATSSNTPAGGTAKPRMSSRHSSHGPVPLATSTSPASATTTPTTDTLKVVQPPTPASPTFASPPTSPTATSKLPRFLQSPAQRDRSNAASSSASHGTTASYTTNTSNSTSTSSASGRRSATRFLGLGKDKERERERQRIREAERGAPSAAELLTLHESQQTSPTSYGFAPSSPPSAYGTARPRTRSERHFSASTPPPSSNSSSSGHGQQQDLTLARTPSRLGADGPLATRLSGWFAHLAGSTSDLSIAATISGSLTHGVSTAAALASSTSSNAAGKKSKAKSDDSHNSNAKSSSKANDSSATTKGGAASSKTSLLDKAVRYLLDGDASPDRSAEEIWLMGVRLPGWGRDDE